MTLDILFKISILEIILDVLFTTEVVWLVTSCTTTVSITVTHDIWGPPIYRQQPSTTDNNRQQTDNNRQQTDNYRQQVLFRRYFQIKRDFYASLPLKRL